MLQTCCKSGQVFDHELIVGDLVGTCHFGALHNCKDKLSGDETAKDIVNTFIVLPQATATTPRPTRCGIQQ